MEGWLIIVGIYIVYYVIKNYFNNRKIEKLVKEVKEERVKNAFKCTVNHDKIEVDSKEDWEVLHVKMKGIVTGPNDNFKLRFLTKIIDITDNVELPIQALLEDFQESNSEFFSHDGGVETFPYESTILNDWTTVVKIPKIFFYIFNI